MAFDNPPWLIDGTTADGEVIRRALGTLISSGGGIVTPGDLIVTQQTVPNMSVTIGTGEIWVPGSSTATQGPYYDRNGAAIVQAISTSSPANPRVDTIGVQVRDAVYTGSAKDMVPFYVMGTPTPGVSVPPTTAAQAAANGAGTPPVSSYVLAYVLVPQSATSIVTADIANVAGVVVPSGQLAPLQPPGSATLANGQLAIAAPGSTMTLPAARKGAVVGVGANSLVTGASPVTVARAGTSVIEGLGLNFATSFPLGAPNAVAILECYDGANWQITAGMQDTGWVVLTSSLSGVSPQCSARLMGDNILVAGYLLLPAGISITPGTALAGIPAPANVGLWTSPVACEASPGPSMGTVVVQISGGSVNAASTFGTGSSGGALFINAVYPL